MIQVPFASPIVDELAKARFTAKPLAFFCDVLKVAPDLLEPYFTASAPVPSTPRWTAACGFATSGTRVCCWNRRELAC